MLWTGITCFHTPPGEAEGILCRVCGTECVVQYRGKVGPTCFAAAIGGSKGLGVPHDFASCPYHDCEWHELARELISEMKNTHSRRLQNLIEEDLREVLEANHMVAPVFNQESLQPCNKCGCTMRAHSAEGECPPPYGNPKGPYGPADPGLGDVPSTVKERQEKP